MRSGKQRKWKVRHEPPSAERYTWVELEDVIRRLQGEIIYHTLPGHGHPERDEIVKHNLGEVPNEVQIMNIIPKDGRTPFVVWEPDESKRNKFRIVIRSDSIRPGDIVVLRVRP